MLEFKQGNIALLSAQFVTVSGMPVDVPDATVQVIGPGGTTVMGPKTMSGPVVTGFYYVDWAVPSSLPTGNYTVRYSGTVLGIVSAITESINIIPAASPTTGISSRQLELIAYLQVYLRCAQCIPVNLELPRRNKSRDQYQFSWPRWNLTNPIVLRNREPIETGYSINYDTGTIIFEQPQHDSDEILCSYNFRWFSDLDLLRFLADALNQINLETPGTTFTLDTVPDQYIGVLMLGGSKNAIKQMIFCLMFQQPSKVFGENSKELQSQLNSLKENNEKEIERDKKQIKRATYPKIGVNVTPEHTLPGGRSRWFRYLYTSSMG